MKSADQTQAEAFLHCSGEAEADGDVAIIETHISRVFLHADRVYKLKRAVKLPYLDFSTPALRLAACEKELALNQRTAPQLYVGVRRVTRDGAGGLTFDGDGELLDAVVEMRRFDQKHLLDAMAIEGQLEPVLLEQLALDIAGFHAKAEKSFARSGSSALDASLRANESGLAQARIFDADKIAAYLALSRARLDQLRARLDRRGAAGFVRRGHGDLHLRNICVYDGQPLLFDCLEFDEELATTDVLYDLAFLLMDLLHHGLSFEANLVFNRYVDATGDDGELELVPFFMGLRAAVRAHVGASAAGEEAGKIADARAYLDLALSLLRPAKSRLVAVAGLSGSGKSSIAAQLAPWVGLPPGARILSTDRLRKHLAGVSAQERLPPESYTPESSMRVYGEQRVQAARVLEGGGSVIVDGVFLKPQERRDIEAVARHLQVAFDGFWLEAPRSILAERIAARRNDPSDATLAVLDMQISQSPGAEGWNKLDATGSVKASVVAARSVLD